LVTGFLRYFKTTSVLDWALKQDKRVVYIARTNNTADESIIKAEDLVRNNGRKLVTLRGKNRICPRIKNSLKDDEECSFEILKVKYCLRCPYKPGRMNPLSRDMRDDIMNQDFIDEECLNEYYNLKLCPAEVILIAAEKFDVVFMTYSWLNFIKDIGGGRLSHIFSDSITIFDEARHLMDFGVEQGSIGERYNGVVTLPPINEIEKFIEWFEPIADKYSSSRRKNGMFDFRESSSGVLHCLGYFCNMVRQKVGGWTSNLAPIGIEDVNGAIKFIEYQLLHVNLSDDEKVMLESALLRLSWIKRHIKSELFVDFNKHYLSMQDGVESIALTARQDKRGLVDIINEAWKVILVDSTPPPIEWSNLWLGDRFDIDVLEINPSNNPDILVWVENRERRFTYMFKFDNIFDYQYAYINKCIFNNPDEKWVISTRTKNELDCMKWLKLFGHKLIHQGGTESEGVQLEGNHIVTGLQYIYGNSYESQRKYILGVLGFDVDDMEVWRDFLLLKTYQTIVQQMFRTFRHDGGCRVVLLGVDEREIEGIKRVFPYIKKVFFSVCHKRRLICDKLMLLENFLNHDALLDSPTAYWKQKILSKFPFNSCSRSKVYKAMGLTNVAIVKKALDELGWRGSGRGMRKI